jgi:hypothetical protein
MVAMKELGARLVCCRYCHVLRPHARPTVKDFEAVATLPIRRPLLRAPERCEATRGPIYRGTHGNAF